MRKTDPFFTRCRQRCRPSALLLFLAAALIFLPPALAQQINFFRIGTGSTAGTYFPIGGIIASAISAPPGSRPCDRGGSCGVPGLIAVAQSTEGSVENVKSIESGTLESGLSQADIAYSAYRGSGVFEAASPMGKLRAVANLFPETVHLVVAAGSGIRRVTDLKAKRVSLDLEGSGTRVDTLLILDAYGLGETDLQAVALPAGSAADRLRAGELDAFFMVVGWPANAVVDLANDSLVDLVPIVGPEIEALIASYPFFALDSIPAAAYHNIGETPTISVGAQLLVSAELPDALVHDITAALWHENTRELLDRGHPKGQLIRLETALVGLGVPLHPGAELYYKEIGVIGVAAEEPAPPPMAEEGQGDAGSEAAPVEAKPATQ